MSRAFQKCGTFPSLEILNRSYGCTKSGQISRVFLADWRRPKKKTRPQFSRFRFHIESAWKKVGYFDADSIWSRNFENCGRVFFFERQLFLMTNSKFQTPLTLNSHKSGLKNHRIKNYHIFGTSRTSAFIWHPRIPHENFCIGVICKNAKKYRFFPFSVSQR